MIEASSARPTRANTQEIEAANRAEATALLIRAGYRVYRPEADVEGEDLVLFVPTSRELRRVQLKGRAHVDSKRYGRRDLWLLFPSARYSPNVARDWFLIPHDELFEWVEKRHGRAPKWADRWSYPTMSQPLRDFLARWTIRALAETSRDTISS